MGEDREEGREKRNKMKKKLLFSAILVFVVFIRGHSVSAEDANGTVLAMEGGVEIFNEEKWDKASDYQPVYAQNIIKTSTSSSVEIMFDDETVVRFEQNTEAEIKITDSVPEVALKRGRVTSSVLPQEEVAFLVSSPLAIIGVRGTEFTVTQTGQGTDVAVYKGRVELSDRSQKPKKVKVSAGKQSFVYTGSFPSTPIGLSPEYKKYRDTELKKFVTRTLNNRKQKEKILLERMKVIKEKSKKIIENLDEKNKKLLRERKEQTAPKR